MTYHALTYKHRCRGLPEAKRRRRLEQLDVRIEQRLGAGGMLEQQAGERVQGEGEEPVEEEAPEGVAGEEEHA